MDRTRLRRALVMGVDVEQFEAAEIYERDGWVCQLCGKSVDAGLEWPDRWSASLDHIIPLSKGGAHARTNVQLAHLSCNGSKGARYGDGQAAEADQLEEVGGDG